jgi:hypothetical protein
VIRGGAEYGLGIFISGVDKGSLSEQSGLCIGDQILSVNGNDFRHITHRDAVQLLRHVNHMSFHLRQINKLPLPKDQNRISISKSLRSSPQILNKSKSDLIDIPPTSNRLINSKRNFLDEIIDPNDKMLIKTNLKEYLEEKILIDELIKPLLDILNKPNQEYRVNLS